MVVAMSLIMVLMTISATLFTALTRSERNATRSAAAQQTLSRLDGLFRGDVHRAQSAALSQDEREQPLLTLAQPGGDSIRYAVNAGVLERTADSGGTTHRDAFRIHDAVWKFEISAEDARRVELILQRPADTVTQNLKDFVPTREWRLLAVLSLTPAAVPPTGATP